MDAELARVVVVTPHAVTQARQRFHGYPAARAEASMRIAGEVAAALRDGRVADNKPVAFRLYRERGHMMQPGQRFVWSEDGERGWVLQREPTQDVVLTSVRRAEIHG